MKSLLITALCLSLPFADAARAAEKKSGTPAKKAKTLPPKSPMIVLPPAPALDAASGEKQKLISSEMSGRDLEFFTTAVEAGRRQAELVALLQSKAESSQIKALGAALVATQGEENRQILRLAASKGWPSPAPTTTPRVADSALARESGSQFDKAVMDQVIASSRLAVGAYQSAAQSTDADIRNFATQMLPMAQEKLRLAEKMTGAGKAAAQFFRTGPTTLPTPHGEVAAPPLAPIAAPPASPAPATKAAPPKPAPIPPPTSR